MPTYDNPIVITHYGPAGVDFGTGGSSGAISFRGPAGMKGRILDLGVCNITEAFAGDTTDGQLLVGTDADTDANALMNIAAGATSAVGDTYNTSNDTDAIIDADLAADTQYEVTCVVGTGGVPAGIGTPYVVVGYFN